MRTEEEIEAKREQATKLASLLSVSTANKEHFDAVYDILGWVVEEADDPLADYEEE